MNNQAPPPYRADPEAFARQMEVFERMRETERQFRAASAASPSIALLDGQRAPAPSFEPRGLSNVPPDPNHPHAALLDRAQHVLLGLQLARRRGM